MAAGVAPQLLNCLLSLLRRCNRCSSLLFENETTIFDPCTTLVLSASQAVAVSGVLQTYLVALDVVHRASQVILLVVKRRNGRLSGLVSPGPTADTSHALVEDTRALGHLLSARPAQLDSLLRCLVAPGA